MIEHLSSAQLTSQKNISTDKTQLVAEPGVECVGVVGNQDFLLGG